MTLMSTYLDGHLASLRKRCDINSRKRLQAIAYSTRTQGPASYTVLGRKNPYFSGA